MALLRSSLLPLVVCLATSAWGYVILKPKGYVRLNDVDGNKKINASTMNSMAFDYSTNLLYVVAHEPLRLTVLSLAVDGTPSILMEHTFSKALDGYPLDVEVCRPTIAGGTPRIAISFTNPTSRSAEGRVVFYKPLGLTTQALSEIQRITVGPFPNDLEFAEDCNVLLVSNKGQATKEGTRYRDPEGTLTKIMMSSVFSDVTPMVTTTITFSDFFTGPDGAAVFEELRKQNFRTFPIRDPTNNVLTTAQNIEPEDIVITENGRTAWVTLPVNNAIAQVNLFTNQVSQIHALGNRSWTDYYMDASDMDGGVNMRGYNIRSLYQATEIRWIEQQGREFLITIDRGQLNINHEYGFVDFERGKTLQSAGIFDTKDPELEAQLADDAQLGRLAISTVDGVRLDGRIETVYTFGGRGFSIHGTRDMGIRSSTVDSLEKVTKQYFPEVFNSAYRSPTSNPQRDSESTSPYLGPYLQAMDIADYKGKHVLFLGGGWSGIIYVYVLAPDAACPQPVFHSVFRAGGKFSSWQSLYDSESMGDIGITEMNVTWVLPGCVFMVDGKFSSWQSLYDPRVSWRYQHDGNEVFLQDIDLSPVLVVTSSISNSVSVYSVEDGPFDADTAV